MAKWIPMKGKYFLSESVTIRPITFSLAPLHLPSLFLNLSCWTKATILSFKHYTGEYYSRDDFFSIIDGFIYPLSVKFPWQCHKFSPMLNSVPHLFHFYLIFFCFYQFLYFAEA